MRFDKCGRAVNSVLRRLTTTHVEHDAELRPLIEDYEKALEECVYNHDGIDYELAKAQQALEDAEFEDKSVARWELLSVKVKEGLAVYWLYTFVWLVPPVLGLLVWVAG